MSELQPLDAWLSADLRGRFGDPERLPPEWIELVEAVHGGN